MGKIISVQIPDTDENKAIIAGLIGIPGVRIETGKDPVSANGKKFVNLREGAEIAGVHYLTFRKWVVEEKKIDYERPSGAGQGGVRLLVENIENFLAGRTRKKSKRGRRGGSVSILD